MSDLDGDQKAERHERVKELHSCLLKMVGKSRLCSEI
jgi:hypothetical protein